jgi:group I intron endonuclease
MNKSGIYKITNTINNKFYIGSSVNIRARITNHRSQLNRGVHDNNHLQRAWDKYGEKSFKVELIKECNDEELLYEEQKYLDKIGVGENPNCYNIAKSAFAPTLGRELSNETKRKIGNANKGKMHTEETKAILSKKHTGKTLSKEHRHKMSISRTGRVCTKETRNKISDALTGIKRTDETRQKLRESHIGIEISQEQRKKMAEGNYKKVVCITTGEVFESLKDAAKVVGVNYTNITNCCRGRQKHAGRDKETGELFEWKYLDEYA